MTLIELQRQIHELLAKHGDGNVEICVEMEIHGKRMQIASELGEISSIISYKQWKPTGNVRYVLINEGFDDEEK